MTPRGRTLTAAAAAAALLLGGALATGAPAAVAAGPACPTPQPPVLVGETGVALEGAVVANDGRLYVTDLFGGRVLRFAAPGAVPEVVATLPERSGGGALALEPDGTIIVGSGADPRVFLGDTLLPGAISRLDPATGRLTRFASGFSAANGLAVARNGTVYATNDFGSAIGRWTRAGGVNPYWGWLNSANGAALSKDDRYLYVSRTFVNPGVSRIPTDRPHRPESLLDLTGDRAGAAPDGLTLDSRDRPVVPTDVAGDIFRIEGPGVTCTLVTGLPDSSVIVYGKGRTGFAAGRLYRAGFDGRIYEIPAGFDAAAAAAG